MEKILNVYFHEKHVGELKQDIHGDLSFTYLESWLSSPQRIKISCSLPLQEKPFKRKECRAFFEGILPEEGQRKLIAKNLGISPNNDYSMLEKIGGECAGALSFIPKGEKFHVNERQYQAISENELPDLLRELPTRPLLAGERGIRLSLAGVQDKLAVYVEEGKIFIPLNNSPSTHILKPDFGVYEGVIFNEAFCLRLAKTVGLSVAEAEIKQAQDVPYLLVKRYDRFVEKNENEEKMQRLHQEDFCQALGIPPNNKYQSENGPSLIDCFSLVKRESAIPVIDLGKLLNAVIFNFLIGNCDSHGKNFSLLYEKKLQLAPLYDLVCTLYYPELSQDMAMKLGGEYKIHHITMENFDKLADKIGFSKPEIRRRVFELMESILSSLQIIERQGSVQERVADFIKKRLLQLHTKLR